MTKFILAPCMTLLFIFSLCSHSLAEIVYSKEAELPPIKLRDLELQKEIDKISNLIATANLAASSSGNRESVTFVSGKDRVEISGHQFVSQKNSIPKAVYRFLYSFRKYGEGAITDVDIDLQDYRRTVSVKGNSPEQVDAIFTTIDASLNAYAVMMGGSSVRSMGGFIFFIVFGWALLLGVIYSCEKKRYLYLLVPAFALIGLILLFTFPFQDILAGFAVYQEEPSFIVRYGYQISFASFLVTILAIPISYLLTVISSNKKQIKKINNNQSD